MNKSLVLGLQFKFEIAGVLAEMALSTALQFLGHFQFRQSALIMSCARNDKLAGTTLL